MIIALLSSVAVLLSATPPYGVAVAGSVARTLGVGVSVDVGLGALPGSATRMARTANILLIGSKSIFSGPSVCPEIVAFSLPTTLPLNGSHSSMRYCPGGMLSTLSLIITGFIWSFLAAFSQV